MIVVGGEECLDRHQPVGPWSIFNHHRFSPACRQPIRKQPRADIHPGARTERNEEFDRPLRPGLRLGVRLRRKQRDHSEKSDDRRTQLRHFHEYPHDPDNMAGTLIALPSERNVHCAGGFALA